MSDKRKNNKFVHIKESDGEVSSGDVDKFYILEKKSIINRWKE